jgi:hypothetical protein
MLEFYKHVTDGLFNFVLFYLLFLFTIVSAFIKTIMHFFTVQFLALKRAEIELEKEKISNSKSED